MLGSFMHCRQNSLAFGTDLLFASNRMEPLQELNRSRTAECNRRSAVLKWALIFFLISIVAGALGYSGVARGAAGIAKILFGLFLILAILILILLYAGVAAVS